MPQLTDMQKVERRVEARFKKALCEYRLIDDGDSILVGLSGGKDSLCLLELLARRARLSVPKFTVCAAHIRMSNIQYESDTSYLQRFCDDLGVVLHVITTGFDRTTDRRKSPCFLCSWYRRKQLFNKAQELGCNKIALGHHQDDIIHTALMNEFFQGRFSSMPVKMSMRKMPLTIIRPLCLEHEGDIKMFAEARRYVSQKKLCPYETGSHRADMKLLFESIENMNAEARHSIWNALERDGKLIE